MSDDATFTELRSALFDATQRDRARERRRQRSVLIPLAVLVTLFVATGLATAANDNFARAVRDLPGGSMFDVFRGEPTDTGPATATSRKASTFLSQFGRFGEAQPDDSSERVLLRTRDQGEDVVIAAKQVRFPRHTQQEAVCWSVATSGVLGAAVCTPAMLPGLPVNFTVASGSARGGGVHKMIAGITDDTVTRIDVVTTRGVQPATMGDHAFYWRSRPGSTPRFLRIHQRDGNVVETSFGLDYAAK